MKLIYLLQVNGKKADIFISVPSISG